MLETINPATKSFITMDVSFHVIEASKTLTASAANGTGLYSQFKPGGKKKTLAGPAITASQSV